MSKGQSVIEVMVALTIFITIASGSLAAILGSYSTTRLAEEETKATLFATEGLEAAQSIRNQNWNNLTNGDHGVSNSGGAWAFSGTSDDPDGTSTYTRVVNVAEVQRDSNGDIVSSGGTVDPETKVITSTITWNFSPTRSNSVEVTSYLTDWQMSRGTPGGGTVVTTCAEYCINQSFSAGTCRANATQCINNSEVNLPTGNQYCTGGGGSDTCCCAP